MQPVQLLRENRAKGTKIVRQFWWLGWLESLGHLSGLWSEVIEILNLPIAEDVHFVNRAGAERRPFVLLLLDRLTVCRPVIVSSLSVSTLGAAPRMLNSVFSTMSCINTHLIHVSELDRFIRILCATHRTYSSIQWFVLFYSQVRQPPP